MNILLLSNNAPNYQHFFKHLAKRLEEDGAKITVAVDSEFSSKINKLEETGYEIYKFDSFFSRHKTDHTLLEKYSDFNLNSALLSDHERAEVYGILEDVDCEYFERLKSALLAYYEEIFKIHGINIVLYENVSNTFAHFAYFVASKHKAIYCGIGGSRLPGRFSITSDPLNDDEPRRIFEQIQNSSLTVPEEIKIWCQDYLKNIEAIVPDYMKINGLDNSSLLKRYLKIDKLKTIITLLRYAKIDAKHSFQIGNPVKHYFNLFKRNLTRNIKCKFLKNYYDEKVEGERYLLYPLHFHPESSTSILSGAYLNEFEVIKNIAFNLPEGIKLYVKDHISAHGFPTLNFYKNLKNLPNTRIIHPSANTKSLIKQSAGVITLTSTVGYEALLLGKYVFLFGKVFYEHHKNIIKIKNPSEIFDILKYFRSHDTRNQENYNINFIASYHISTKKGTLNLMLASDGAKKIVDDLYPEILNHINRYSIN